MGHDNVLEVEKQLLHIMVEITTTSFSSSCKVCKKKFFCLFVFLQERPLASSATEKDSKH